MKRISYLLVFFLCALVEMSAQDFSEKENTQAKSASRLNVESFGYPDFLDSEKHSSFTVSYELDPSFLIELQSFYDTYRLYDVAESRLRIKKYLSNRLYLFSGLGIEKEIDKHGFKPPPVRVKLLNGFGYDVDEKFYLEATHDLHFNKTNFGNYGTPNLFSLSGKYKF